MITCWLIHGDSPYQHQHQHHNHNHNQNHNDFLIRFFFIFLFDEFGVILHHSWVKVESGVPHNTSFFSWDLLLNNLLWIALKMVKHFHHHRNWAPFSKYPQSYHRHIHCWMVAFHTLIRRQSLRQPKCQFVHRMLL